MEITKLSRQKKGNRINIYIDEEYAFSLDESNIVRYNLFNGKKITEEEIVEFERLSITDKLYSYSLDLISRRPRSCKEIRQKLLYKFKHYKTIPKTDKEEQERLIDDIISRLKNKKYLDDNDFTAWWIRNRLETRPRGIYLLKKELLQKGIDREIIETQISLIYPENDSYIIKKEFEKKLRSIKTLPKEKQYNRMLSYLLRKGFKYDKIISLFREVDFQ